MMILPKKIERGLIDYIVSDEKTGSGFGCYYKTITIYWNSTTIFGTTKCHKKLYNYDVYWDSDKDYPFKVEGKQCIERLNYLMSINNNITKISDFLAKHSGTDDFNMGVSYGVQEVMKIFEGEV